MVLSRCAVVRALVALVTVFSITTLAQQAAWAQGGGGGLQRQQSVGGVFVDAKGVVANVSLDEQRQLAEARAKALAPAKGEMQDRTELRKISLRQLEAALATQLQNKQPIPDEMRYLAGLQRIRYVFVYPDRQDVVLAGPGEGWKVDARGNVVGLTTLRPVLLLDDLLVALRSAAAEPRQNITCSIDPTPEGMLRLQAFVSQLTGIGSDPRATTQAIEQQLGPQIVTVTGVPASSHLGRVLVAADYRMKRLAMQFDPSPIAGLPGYLNMIPSGGRGMNNMAPRWWLSTDYLPLLRDDEGTAWELQGPGVKVLSEEEFIGKDGTRTSANRLNPHAQRWAENMTRKYDELSSKDTIFAELRNVMDLAVIAALMIREQLPQKASLSMPLLLDNQRLPTDNYGVATQTPSISSAVHKGSSWVISVSGGVEIQSHHVAARQEKKPELSQLQQQQRAADAKRWWWN